MALAHAAALSSCARAIGTNKKIVKECVLPTVQKGSLTHKWRVTPVPLALKTANFDAGDATAIAQAAQTWNDFFGQSQKIQVLDIGKTDAVNESNTARPADICAVNQLPASATQFSGNIVIYRQTHWPYSNHKIIALTSFCRLPAPGGKGLPNAYSAMIEVNFEDFFVEGRKQPDMQSILLHELGHLLGIDHSCDTSGKPGLPVCPDASRADSFSDQEKAFFEAVMFPVVPFFDDGTGEERRDLNDNDMGRANCVYETNTNSGTGSSSSTSNGN